MLSDSVSFFSSNFLCDPSQIGGNCVSLQVQNDMNLSAKAVYVIGFLPCLSSLCDPSQKGCFFVDYVAFRYSFIVDCVRLGCGLCVNSKAALVTIHCS